MGLTVCRHVFRKLALTNMVGTAGLSVRPPALFAMGLISLQMCSCFMIPHYKKQHKGTLDAFRNDLSQPLDVVELRPVSIHEFERKLNHAKSYRDVLRIFYGKGIPDHVIDEILETEVPYETHGKLGADYAGYSSDRRYDRKADGEAAKRHFDEMRHNPITHCKEPRPKVIHMRDNLSVGSGIRFWPKCTVVYRCEADSGCCGHGKVCLPKKVERVPKSFLVTEFLLGQQLVRPRHESFTDTFIFENHTECECQVKATYNNNKCMACPFPFTLTKGAPDCVCDCDQDSIVCLQIKEGNRSFDEKPLQCIKEEKCHEPLCAYANFDMKSLRSGYCPGKPKEKPSVRVETDTHRKFPTGPEVTPDIWFGNYESSGFGDDDMEDDEYNDETNYID